MKDLPMPWTDSLALDPAAAPERQEPPALRTDLPEPPPETRPAASARRARAGWLGAIGLVLVKVLKSAKFIKFALFALSLWALAWHHPFGFACAVLYALFVHESGHVLAMRWCGIKTGGMYFIPMLGAVALAKEPPRTRGEEWLVAAAGPAFGLLSLVPLAAIPILTPTSMSDTAAMMNYAATAAFINLFNLLPIGILDGGRMLQAIAFSVSRWFGVVVFGGGMLGGAFLLFGVGGGIFSIILLISLVEFVVDWKKAKTDSVPKMSWAATLASGIGYLALLGAFGIAFDVFPEVAKWAAAHG